VELRNILKDLNLGGITTANIKDIGQSVYADISAKKDVTDLNEIMTAWQMVHAPLSGQPIPSTSSLNYVSADENNPVTLLTPSVNEVVKVSGFWVTNSGLSNITVQFFLIEANTDEPSRSPIAVTDLTTVAGAVSIMVPTFSGTTLYLDYNHTVMGICNTGGMEMGAITNQVSQ